MRWCCCCIFPQICKVPLAQANKNPKASNFHQFSSRLAASNDLHAVISQRSLSEVGFFSSLGADVKYRVQRLEALLTEMRRLSHHVQKLNDIESSQWASQLLEVAPDLLKWHLSLQRGEAAQNLVGGMSKLNPEHLNLSRRRLSLNGCCKSLQEMAWQKYFSRKGASDTGATCLMYVFGDLESKRGFSSQKGNTLVNVVTAAS